jgi:hypothetical protein
MGFPDVRFLPPHMTLDNFKHEERVQRVFQVLINEISEDPAATPEMLRDVVDRAFPENADTGEGLLSFEHARALDHYFFNTGRTRYWLRAHDFPVDVSRAGIFTFA